MSDSVSLNASKERGARTYSGYLMFAVALLLLGVFIWSIFNAIEMQGGVGRIGSSVGWFVAFTIASSGFYMLQPIRAPIVKRGCAGSGRG
jgi:hypothetical protein